MFREGESKNEDGPLDPERLSGIMRVSNIPAEKEQEILHSIKTELFDDQEKYLSQEREKTPIETEIISAVINKLPDFIKRYGGKSLDLNPDHVHIVDWEKLTDQQKEEHEKIAGKFLVKMQRAAIFSKPNYSLLKFAETAVHELIHFCSFQAVNYDDKTEKLSERVMGFSMTVNNRENKESDFYFNAVNEAITAELTKRFCEEHFSSISVLKEEIKERDQCRAGIKKGDPTEIMAFKIREDSNGLWHATSEDYPYVDERSNGWATMANIRAENPGVFESDEDVFKFFAKAYFTGNFLEIARLIEKNRGKGSFRKMGEKTKAK